MCDGLWDCGIVGLWVRESRIGVSVRVTFDAVRRRDGHAGEKTAKD